MIKKTLHEKLLSGTDKYNKDIAIDITSEQIKNHQSYAREDDLTDNKTVDELTSSDLVLNELKYKTILKFAEEVRNEIEKQRDSISPQTIEQLLAEVNRIIRMLRLHYDNTEIEINSKINVLWREMAPYNEKKDGLG